MDSLHKSKEQLIQELTDLRWQVAQFKKQEAQYNNVQAIIEASQRQIRLLRESVALSYQSLDENGRLSTVNQAWLDMLGYKKENVIGRWFGDFLAPAAQEQFREAFPLLKSQGFVQSVELEMIRQDGERLIIVIDGRVEYDALGQFQRTHCILSDITAHRQTDLALQESLKRFHLVMNSLDAAIYVSDMETYELLFANKYVRDIVGGIPIEGKICWQTLQTGQTGPCDFCTNKFLVTADGKAADIYEWEFQNTIDGKWYHIQDQAIPWVDGRLVRLEIATDITERKQAEHALQYRIQFEKFIAALSTQFVSLAPGEIDNGINQALRAIGEFIGADRCYIFLLDPNGARADNTHEWCAEGVASQIDGLQAVPTHFFPWWMDKLRRFENVHIPCVADLPPQAAAEKELLQTQDIQSLVVVPLIHSQQLVGFAGFDTVAAEKTWSEDILLLLRMVGDLIASALKRRETETALRESEARYRQMFEAHSSIQWLVDPQTQQLVDVNPASAKFYGYTREQMRQMKVSDLNILSQKEIAARLTQAKSQQRDYFIVPHRLASGEICQMEIYSVPVSVGGRSLLYAILHDITERIQAEEGLRQSNRELALLSQARQALNSSLELDQVLTAVLDEVRFLVGAVACSIWLTDPATGELVCRQVTEPHSNIVRGWRLEPGQGIAGWVTQSGQSLVLPDAQVDSRHFKEVDEKTRLKTRALLCVPLQIKEQIIGVVQVLDTTTDSFNLSDLTLMESLAETAAIAIENAQLHERLADHAAQMEKRVVERTRELVRANEQLKELDKLRTKLIEDISHELRTPVANLSLYLDLLDRGKPEKRDHYMAVLHEKMDQLVHLTEDVLGVFRLDLFKGDVAFEPVNLNELVRDVLGRLKQRVQESNLDLLFKPETALPDILAERRQLYQAITNLLVNAINYTPSGSVQVSTDLDAERKRVWLRVKDTGMGIAPEDLPYVFDRFFRGQQVGQFNMPGTGLGLAVVRDIVALHGGEVDVTSEPGQGSVFRVWLPVGDG